MVRCFLQVDFKNPYFWKQVGFGLSKMILSVDGGHRAIKYSRISGVKKEIYNEGTISLQSNISLG